MMLRGCCLVLLATAVRGGARRTIDGGAAGWKGGWRTSLDTTMGGRSTGAIKTTDGASVMVRHGVAIAVAVRAIPECLAMDDHPGCRALRCLADICGIMFAGPPRRIGVAI